LILKSKNGPRDTYKIKILITMNTNFDLVSGLRTQLWPDLECGQGL
jgi:hypothetical protein